MSEKYKTNRPTIPAVIRREVEVEAGYTCSIKECNEHTYLEVHHINANREDNKVDNLILLCDKHHKMAHANIIDRKSLYAFKKRLCVEKESNSTFNHGTVSNGNVVLKRTDGIIHLLDVAGSITITTDNWITDVDKIILKVTNAGSHATTWNNIKALPFASGDFSFSVQGTDIIELNRYDGDVYFKSIYIENVKK